MIKCVFESGKNADLGLRHCVVDTLVIKGNKILLVKRAPHLLNGGKYALIGGFVSRDEDTKATVKREVKEETGCDIEVEFLLRIADNPTRPQEDRQNIAFVYVVKVINEGGLTDSEVSEIKWFDLNNLPPKEQFAFDHLENIELYKKYLKEKFTLPFIGEI